MPFIIMIIIMTLSAMICALLLAAYLSTLNFKESLLLLSTEFKFYFKKNYKLEVYKNVHNKKIQAILNKISSTSDKDLVKMHPDLTIDDAKKIKSLAIELLKQKKYLISDDMARRDLNYLGLNSFVYSFQMRLAFASDPNNQYIYSRKKSKYIITNKQQLEAKRKRNLLNRRKMTESLDDNLLSTLITFESIVQKLFKNKQSPEYAMGI